MKLFPILLASLFVCAAASLAHAAEPIGVVIGLQGAAQAVAPDGQARTLKMRGAVFMGDTLRTGNGAKLQIVFGDDTLFSLGENTEAVLDEYVYLPARAKDNAMFIRMVKGLSRIVTGRITDLNPDRFTVKTGRATIGIRGCELGFLCGRDADRVYVIRVPAGRRVRITPDSGAAADLRDPGWLDIRDDGTTKRGALTDEDLHMLSDETTPVPSGFDGEDADIPTHDPGSAQDPVTEAEDSAPSSSPASTSETTAEDQAETLSGDVATDPSDPGSSLTEEQPSGDASQPAPAPSPAPPLRGGGLGGVYMDNPPMNAELREVFVHRRVVSGTLGNGFTSVDMEGLRYDDVGNAVPVYLSFRDIPLARFGGSERFEGWASREVAPGVRVANDNLQEFVYRTDRTVASQRLTYWGYPAGAFSGSALPAGTVVGYDVMLAAYPPRAPLPHDPVSELRPAFLLVNTRTGGFYVEHPGIPPAFGRAADLQFFGRESQGVGSAFFKAPTTLEDPGLRAYALAGFRQLGSERPAEAGGWTRYGYAAAIGVPIDFAAPIREMHSANMFDDDPLLNERQVAIQLNRAAALDNVNLDLRLYENPASPQPNDLRLHMPEFSTFVADHRFGAAIRHAEVRADLYGAGGGEHWTWGEWNGEQTVDHGGGSLMREETHGHYVVGDTLSPAAFQDLVTGSAVYNLNTPYDRPGHMLAVINSGNYQSKIHGTALLSVTIPAGGASASWSGTFHAGNVSAGDYLDVVYGTRLVTDNGHLMGTGPDTYGLRANGVNYNDSSFTGSGITGSLVGPGTGARPITGAIGSGRFSHNDGTTVNFTYGTDLVP